MGKTEASGPKNAPMETMKQKNKEKGKERMTGGEKEMIVCRKRWDNKLLPFISSAYFRGNSTPLLLRHI